MAGDAERLQILEVVQATQGAVGPTRRAAVVDLEPFRRAAGAPGAHRSAKVRFAREARAGRPLGWDVAAPAATVLVASLGRSPGDRPPVILPEGFAAAVAAPGPPPRGERRTAPGTPAGTTAGQFADRQERRALRPFGRHAQRRAGPSTRLRTGSGFAASSRGELVPVRNSGRAAAENWTPVQNAPNSP